MKLRDDDALSPEAERELEALDAALRGRPVDPELEAVAGLARALRAERVTAPPAFVAELDDRVAEGFGRDDAAGPVTRARQWLAVRPPRRILAPAVGVATLVVVVGVAISHNGGGGEGDVSTVAQPAGSEAQSLQAPEAPAPADIAPAPGRDGLAPGQHERKVERAAELALSTDPGNVPNVADDVVAVTDRYRGIIVSSRVGGGLEGSSGASFDLAIPATRVSDALAALSELADVSARSESTLDITEPFVSARERLSDAHAELESLLAQLAQAGTAAETRSIRSQIDSVRGEISQARSQAQDLARRARYARVSVIIEGSGGGGGWSLGDAADDALEILRTTAGVGLVSLAVLVPAGLVAAAAWFVVRGAARRRRERALD